MKTPSMPMRSRYLETDPSIAKSPFPGCSLASSPASPSSALPWPPRSPMSPPHCQPSPSSLNTADAFSHSPPSSNRRRAARRPPSPCGCQAFQIREVRQSLFFQLSIFEKKLRAGPVLGCRPGRKRAAANKSAGEENASAALRGAGGWARGWAAGCARG